jgi:hypothetical protein
VCEIEADRLFAEKQAIAVDSVGIVDIVDEPESCLCREPRRAPSTSDIALKPDVAQTRQNRRE